MMAKKKTAKTKTADVSTKLEVYDRIREILESARQNVARSVNTTQVVSNWLVGREIVEEEQAGRARAEYGERLLPELSKRLQEEFGRGYSLKNLEYFRTFYLTYHSLIASPISEIESIKNNWSARELERQINSLLFERLAKSKDKQGVMELATRGQEVMSPLDIFKDPVVIEFVGLPESNRLVESDLETSLIDNLQAFLLELGKGFAFVSRQERITLDGDHFYIDLVFYHTILK